MDDEIKDLVDYHISLVIEANGNTKNILLTEANNLFIRVANLIKYEIEYEKFSLLATKHGNEVLETQCSEQVIFEIIERTKPAQYAGIFKILEKLDSEYKDEYNKMPLQLLNLKYEEIKQQLLDTVKFISENTEKPFKIENGEVVFHPYFKLVCQWRNIYFIRSKYLSE